MGTSDVHGLIDWDYPKENNFHRPITFIISENRTKKSIRDALFQRKTFVWHRDMIVGEEENIEKQNDDQSVNAEEKDQNTASVDNLRVLENIDVRLTVEVGSAELKIKELLRLNEGSVIELDRLAGDPLDILINGTMIAKGEVVMVGERFGIRFVEIVDPQKE